LWKGSKLKSDRLLAELMLLQGHGRMTTRQVAERLEISQRTAHRDMESLCAAGVPLVALRGSQGGWELEKGWRTQVPALDPAELEALLMARTGSLGSTRLRAAAQRAFDKLMAALPASSRHRAESLLVRLHFDPSGWRAPGDDLSMLPIVQDALARDLKLTFTYTRADGETTARTAEPLGIVCKQSVWYLVAQTPAGMRTFRVSRIRDATVLPQTFERPAGFDLAQYWTTATERLRDRRDAVNATLALSPKGAAALREWRVMRPIGDHPTASRLPPEWFIFEIEFDDLPQARFTALGLGMEAIVLDPEPLRDEIESEASRVVERNRSVR
jgi:predicted DNA-binding transcriptional regulator YafY